MSTETLLDQAQQLLAPWTQETHNPEPNRLDVVLDAAYLAAATQALLDTRWGYLAAITGLDPGPETGELEVLYHFCSGAAVVTLRARIPRDDAKIPTVCHICPSASPFERELSEMFGITVTGTPDPTRLFLPDDWPEGVYPLRKDASLSDI